MSTEKQKIEIEKAELVINKIADVLILIARELLIRDDGAGLKPGKVLDQQDYPASQRATPTVVVRR